MTNFEVFEDELKEAIKEKELPDFALKHGLHHFDTYTLMQWLLQEHEVLTPSEKEYLSAALKPFKNVLKIIEKCESVNHSSEFIGIEIKSLNVPTKSETMLFPSFEKGTMYKNMELERAYTAEELGLWN